MNAFGQVRAHRFDACATYTMQTSPALLCLPMRANSVPAPLSQKRGVRQVTLLTGGDLHCFLLHAIMQCATSVNTHPTRYLYAHSGREEAGMCSALFHVSNAVVDPTHCPCSFKLPHCHMLLDAGVYLLSPLLRTLTKTVSEDSVIAMTAGLLILHLYLHDYK